MARHGAEEGLGQLIPGLPEDILLAEVVPRLPWYTRPLCRTLSKSWRTLLDARNPELDLRTRMIQLPLLRGLFLLCTFDKQILIRDDNIHEPQWINGYKIQSQWRKLPPLDGSLVPTHNNAAMVASSGMVYVWSRNMWINSNGAKFVSKLDMGCADWTWRKVPVPYNFSTDAVSFNGKIYVPKVFTTGFQKVVLEHDMMTDICRQVEGWNQSELRVVLKKSPHMNAGVEEMYGFEVEDFAENLKVVIYDAVSDSWRSWEEVPIPRPRWTLLPEVQLLNGDCFDPAPAAGINIVWDDAESKLFSWFNSTQGSKWVDIAYNSYLEGRYLKYIQFVHGTMYGIFCDEEEEEEDTAKEGGLAGLLRRTIMKGRIVLESSRVVWEDVHEMGFFREGFLVNTAVTVIGVMLFVQPTVLPYMGRTARKRKGGSR